MQSKLSAVQTKVVAFTQARNYKLISDLSSIQKQTDKFEYECVCGTRHTRNFNNIACNKGELENPSTYLPSCCASLCSPEDPRYKWYLDGRIKEYLDQTNQERWVKFSMFWVSDQARVLSHSGNPVQPENGRFKLSRKMYAPEELLAEAFRLSQYPKQVPYFENGVVSLATLRFREGTQKLTMERLNIKDVPLQTKISAGVQHHVLPEFPEHTFFIDGCVYFKKAPKSVIDRQGFIEVKINDIPYRVDKLLLCCFRPFEGKTKYDEYADVLITYKDNNPFNINLDNIEPQRRKMSDAEIRAINEEKRISNLRKQAQQLVADREGDVQLDELNKITTVHDKFFYTCACKVVKERSVQNFLEQGLMCNTCKTAKVKQATTAPLDDFTFDGQLFKQWEYGWVGNQGIFLNNLKQKVFVNTKDLSITFAGINFNAKYVMAKVYKIPHFDKLQEQGYFVRIIDEQAGVVPENLYVWSFDFEKKKLLPLSVSKHEAYKQQQGPRAINLFSCSTAPEFECKEFQQTGIKVFANGCLQIDDQLFTFGSTNQHGYKITHIEGITYFVHRLVAFLFKPIEGFSKLEDYKDEQGNPLQVDHIDGDTTNNAASNLRWCTNKENARFAVDSGVSFAVPVRQYAWDDVNGRKNLIQTFVCIKDAVKASKQSYDFIVDCCMNKKVKRKEWDWEFVNSSDAERYNQPSKKRVFTTIEM
jgi:hypothetical protein